MHIFSFFPPFHHSYRLRKKALSYRSGSGRYAVTKTTGLLCPFGILGRLLSKPLLLCLPSEKNRNVNLSLNHSPSHTYFNVLFQHPRQRCTLSPNLNATLCGGLEGINNMI